MWRRILEGQEEGEAATDSAAAAGMGGGRAGVARPKPIAPRGEAASLSPVRRGQRKEIPPDNEFPGGSGRGPPTQGQRRGGSAQRRRRGGEVVR